MKNLFTLISAWLLPYVIVAQCMVSVTTTPASCFEACDGTATATITGCQNCQISWSPGSCTTATCTNLCAGAFTVSIFGSNGCSAFSSGTVTAPPMLNLAVSIPTQPSCPTCCDGTGLATASGGTPPYNYIWTPSGPSNLCNAVYEVCVVDANGCMTCDTVYVGAASILNNEVPFSLSIIPNPATNVIIISCPTFKSGFDLVIFDVTGQAVIQRTDIEDSMTGISLDVSSLPAGIFFICFMSENAWASGRFVK